MATKVWMTIEKERQDGELVLEKIEAGALVELLKGGSVDGDSYREAIEALRRELPSVRGIGLSMDYLTQHVPRIYPSALLRYDKGRLIMDSYTGVVLLDIQNVFDEESRSRVMDAVRTLPMTLMAFTGSSGMSMKVLVLTRPASDKRPRTMELTELYHRAAHKQMRALYSTIVPFHISPAYDLKINDGFLLSLDEAVYYDPEAVPARVDKTLKTKSARTPKGGSVERELRLPVPADRYHRDYYDRLFDGLLKGVREEFVNSGRDLDLESEAYLRTVVERAAELNIEEAELRARLMRMYEWKIDDEIGNFVRMVYDKRYPLPSSGNKTRDMVRGMLDVLNRNYEFRQNVVNHALYFRERTTMGEWRRLQTEEVNTLTLEVQEAGVNANTHHIQTFLNSRRIPQVNPVAEMVQRLRGKWDGRDRIEALARRVPTTLKQWPKYFHIWFLAMVRQWTTLSPEHGNEVVPLLIGPQGIGKSSFCRRLLPPELIDGYIDHLDFSEEKEVLRAMAVFQLINIDEFNRYSSRNQSGKLKNYLQMNDIRLRKMRQQTFEVLQRMASFIGTSNPTEVLADTTGTRRFICVPVTGVIDQITAIDYDQLYAQAIDELDAREQLGSRATTKDVGRTYFTKAEERVIQRHNAKFMQSSVAVERFRQMFEPIATPRRARSNQDSMELTREEIFQQVERGLRTALSEVERKRLYAHLNQLADSNVLYKKRLKNGNVYHLKYIKTTSKTNQYS